MEKNMAEDNNRRFRTDYINTGEFDREYHLTELITESFFTQLISGIRIIGMENAFLFNAEGDLCYPETVKGGEIHEAVTDLLKRGSISSKTFLIQETGDVIVPLNHEMEDIGYICLAPAAEITPESAEKTGHLIAFMVKHHIEERYKILMTSGLHSKVVTENFEEISDKTEQLRKSEEKYRHLAEQLEEEVMKQAEEIKKANLQLMHQEKMASIGQLAAGVAHEINNPMGYIGSNLKRLNEYVDDLREMINVYRRSFSYEDYGQPDEFKRLVSTTEKEIDIDYLMEDLPALILETIEGADRVNKIVSDLKDFAHPGDDGRSYADINSCITSTLNIVNNEIKYKADVMLDLGDIPPVLCSPRLINQVIMNLLVNAAQAIETTGKIRIETRADDSYLIIIVEDDGPGIPEENQARIFDPFFTTKDVGKGTGLGLNICYGIIKDHGGSINVESTLGSGTRFTIRIPVDREID